MHWGNELLLQHEVLGERAGERNEVSEASLVEDENTRAKYYITNIVFVHYYTQLVFSFGSHVSLVLHLGSAS